MKTDHCIFHLLHAANQAASREFETTNALTTTQFIILAALDDSPDILNQKRLVALTGIDRSTMANVLYRLQNAGMVNRAECQRDRRAIEVTLTKKGKTALVQAREAATRSNEVILAQIPESRRKAFIRDLEGIGRVAVEAVKEAA